MQNANGGIFPPLITPLYLLIHVDLKGSFYFLLASLPFHSLPCYCYLFIFIRSGRAGAVEDHWAAEDEIITVRGCHIPPHCSR